jgi:putative ABC transport system substrate-binding protein
MGRRAREGPRRIGTAARDAMLIVGTRLRSTLCLALAGLALFSAAANAQQTARAYRIGVLHDAFAANHPAAEGLRAGLGELGLVEGQNLVFEVRFTEGKPEAAPAAVKALLDAGVDVLFTSGEAATNAARQATKTVPIVFTLIGDPVAAGIVERLAHPGGNVTGVSSLTTELVGKRLEMLRTVAPHVKRVWVIHAADDPSSRAAIAKAEEAGSRLALAVEARAVKDTRGLDAALKEVRPGDALLPPDVATLDIPVAMLETSIASRIPAVFPTALWVEHGGLAAYGPDYRAQGVQAARLVEKILRGARPRDLPVEGADHIHLAINLKTADLVGATIPRKYLLWATRLQR